jgi:hypothetical protein
MAQVGRTGTRSMLLAIAWGMGLIVIMTGGVWIATGALPLSQAASSRPTSTGIGVGQLPTASRSLPSGVPSPPGGADQLKAMDPNSLDKLVAREDGATRRGQSQSTAAKATWLVGDVGTYLVGRGVSTGTYESAGASHGKTCRWIVTGRGGEHLRSGASASRTVVTINKTDGFFQTNDCLNWRKVT